MTVQTRGNPQFGNPLIHLAGCDLLDMPPEEADPHADIATTRDDLIRYALAVRPHYDTVGRLIGQLAGLFILAQARGRFEPDFEAYSTPVEQARACADAVYSMTAPKLAWRQHWCINRAMALVGQVVDEFSHPLQGADEVRDQVIAWNRQLKRANMLLRWAADRSLGLNPVDFKQACCCAAA